jgi:urease accessory protein UreE
MFASLPFAHQGILFGVRLATCEVVKRLSGKYFKIYNPKSKLILAVYGTHDDINTAQNCHNIGNLHTP